MEVGRRGIAHTSLILRHFVSSETGEWNGICLREHTLTRTPRIYAQCPVYVCTWFDTYLSYVRNTCIILIIRETIDDDAMCELILPHTSFPKTNTKKRHKKSSQNYALTSFCIMFSFLWIKIAPTPILFIAIMMARSMEIVHSCLYKICIELASIPIFMPALSESCGNRFTAFAKQLHFGEYYRTWV